MSSTAAYAATTVAPVPGSISTSAMWQPLGKVEPNLPSATTETGFDLARSPSFTVRFDSFERYSPFAYSTCEGSTPSSRAAAARPASISFCAARWHTLPAPTVLREPPV